MTYQALKAQQLRQILGGPGKLLELLGGGKGQVVVCESLWVSQKKRLCKNELNERETAMLYIMCDNLLCLRSFATRFPIRRANPVKTQSQVKGYCSLPELVMKVREVMQWFLVVVRYSQAAWMDAGPAISCGVPKMPAEMKGRHRDLIPFAVACKAVNI